MSKGTKLPLRAPGGTTGILRVLRGDSLAPTTMVRPGALLCPQTDRDTAERIRGTGYHPGPSSLFTPHHHERSASAHFTRG